MANVSLKEYFESKIAAIEKATTLANDNLKTRLEGLNEWRLQNKDERSLFVARGEMDAEINRLDEKIEAKIEGLDKNRKDKTALVIAVIGTAISILSFLIINFFKH